MPITSFLWGTSKLIIKAPSTSVFIPPQLTTSFRRTLVCTSNFTIHHHTPAIAHDKRCRPFHTNTGYNNGGRYNFGGKGELPWFASLLGVSAVFGYIATRADIHCQAEEAPLPIELVLTKSDDNTATISVWKEILLPDLPFIILAIMAAIASSVIGLLLPSVFGEIVDKAKEGAVVSVLKIPALKAIGIILLQGVIQFGYIAFVNLAAERMVTRLKNIFFSSILAQDIAFFDKYSTGDLMSRLTSDIQLIRLAFKHSISMGVRSAVSFAGGAVSLFMISKELSLLMLLVIPGVVLVGTVYARYLKRLSERVQKSIGQANAVASEVISNMRTVRAFTNEDLEIKRFAEKSDESLVLSQKMGTQLGILQGLTTIALNGIGLIVYWYGGYQVSLGQLTPGSLTSFMMHTFSLQTSLQHLSMLLGQGFSALGAVVRLDEIAQNTPKIGGSKHVSTHLLKLPNVKGTLELKNVNFSYPSRVHQQVLTNFSLTLPAGKLTALAGPSGGGKTTISSLIERFYDPQSGEVTLDDVPLTVLDPTWLRSQIGVVSQEPVLFATSIKENIAYGKPGASEEEIITAAQRAYVHGFVTSFPDGYNTMVGERGIQLSGGQKQRIAIARAILKNPRILILDEATSALDSESEGQVQEALHELMKGRTVLVIAHRLSTVQSADNIAVVCDGQIVETGTHAELMRKAGMYSQLVARQLH